MNEVIVHLSDPHLTGDPHHQADTAFALTLQGISEREADTTVVVTGDIAASGADRQRSYETLRNLVGQHRLDVVAVAGNHDCVDTLKSVLGDPSDRDRFDYVTDREHVRIVVLDSSRRGQIHGTLDDDQIGWLTDELDNSTHDTIVAFHHPPISCGVPVGDRHSLDEASCERLSRALQGRANIVRVLSGHTHSTVHAMFAGHPTQIAGSSSHYFVDVDGKGQLRRHSRLEYLRLSRSALHPGHETWVTKTIHLT